MNLKSKAILAVLIIGLFVLAEKKFQFSSSKSEPIQPFDQEAFDQMRNQQNENSAQASENADGFSGNICAECGKKCKKEKEMYSSGDAMSGYQPYYLCGDMNCVNKRYDKNMLMKKHERNEQQYRNYNRAQGEEEPTLYVE